MGVLGDSEELHVRQNGKVGEGDDAIALGDLEEEVKDSIKRIDDWCKNCASMQQIADVGSGPSPGASTEVKGTQAREEPEKADAQAEREEPEE